MLDVQKQRLRHLLATAILDLWKKETGSQSSVLIEGTICITAGSGKTTVVQVSDRFHGNIPELSNSEDSGIGTDVLAHSFSNKSLHHSSTSRSKLPEILHGNTDYHGNPAAVLAAASFLDNPFLPPHLQVPVGPKEVQQKHVVQPKQEPVEQEMETLTQSVSGDAAATEADEVIEDNDKDKDSTPAGPVCPGTGYYTCGDKHDSSDEDDDDDEMDSDMESFEAGDRAPYSTSTPKAAGPVARCSSTDDRSPSSSRSDPDEDEGDKGSDDDALDLSSSKREGSVTASDLALSSPHSYTAQVQDVIKQRIRGKIASASELSPCDTPPSVSEPTPQVERSRPLTPPAHMMSSLAAHAAGVHKRSFSHSWPGARDKPYYSHPLFSPGGRLPTPPGPGAFSPLTIGLPNGPASLAHSSMSPGMLPALFLPPRGPGGPAFPPVPPGLSDILSKPPLTSPSQASTSSSPDDTTHPVFPSPSPTSPPDPTDVNGNMEKDPVTGEQKVYRCEFCSKTFLFKSKYHEHLPVHTNARPFQCHMCSRTYKYKYDLRVHLRTHMGIPTKSTVCPFCSSKFSTNKILRIHIKDAHRERQRSLEESTQQAEAQSPSIGAATHDGLPATAATPAAL